MKLLNNKGQSLVELIVAIAVIEIGIFSVWSLFLINFNAEREAEMRIVGVNLAREGVEVIKNIRDSNWLKSNNNTLKDAADPSSIWPWDDSLAAGAVSVNFDSPAPLGADFDALYIDSYGYYSNVALGQLSPYKRKVTLNNICCADADGNFRCDNTDYSIIPAPGACPLKIGVNIVSDVTWQISGNSRHAVVEDNIYNWK